MATMAQAIRMALHYGEEHLGVTLFERQHRKVVLTVLENVLIT